MEEHPPYAPQRRPLCGAAASPRAHSSACPPRADARSDVLTDVEFDAFEVWIGKVYAEKGVPPTAEEVRPSPPNRAPPRVAPQRAVFVRRRRSLGWR